MKYILLTLFCLLSFNSPLLAGKGTEGVIGFWKTIDDTTGKPESIVAIYEYHSKYYGRIVATYNDAGQIKETLNNPHERAPGVKGNPYYVGLDIIWDLRKDQNKYKNGEILDPEKGRVYDAQMWRDNGKLIVRGQLLFFGRNQTWLAATDSDFPQGFNKPDLSKLIPSIPKTKSSKDTHIADD